MTPPADKDNQAGQGTAGTAGAPAPETNNGATGTPGTTAPENNNQAGQGTAGTAGTPALILITVQLVLLVKTTPNGQEKPSAPGTDQQGQDTPQTGTPGQDTQTGENGTGTTVTPSLIKTKLVMKTKLNQVLITTLGLLL